MQVERVLSSAKTINLRKLDDWVKSLINNQKSNGPRLKTWGTPIENRGLIEVHRVTKYRWYESWILILPFFNQNMQGVPTVEKINCC